MSQGQRTVGETSTGGDISRIIPHRTITEYIAHWIREQIAQGRLQPGIRVREARIARELKTSRAPVREAINQLTQEGLMSKAPNQSARVVELTEPLLREVATLRGVLERFGASLAAERLEYADLQTLKGIVRLMQSEAEAGNFSGVVQQDYAFHAYMMKAARHQLLYDTWSRLGGLVKFLVSGTNHIDRDLVNIAKTHANILAAIQAKDDARAQQLLSVHLTEMFDHFLARIVRVSPGATRSRRGEGQVAASAENATVRKQHRPKRRVGTSSTAKSEVPKHRQA